MKRNVCVTLTSRGNYGKMRSVIEKILETEELELQLIVGGGALLQKYGDISRALTADGITIDRRVYFLVEGGTPLTMAKSTGMVIGEFSTAFDDLKPDMVMVVGDRFESLGIAIAAAYMNIPLVHLEGGEVSGSIDESIRHAVTKLAHLHFPATHDAAKRIEKMGEDPKTIFPVGATSLDMISRLNLENLDGLVEIQKKEGLGPVINLKDPYLVLIQHPVTTEYENNLNDINETIRAVEALEMNCIWIWSNMDAGSDFISQGIQSFIEQKNPQYIHFFKGLAIEYYAPLLKNAACLVGNSSSGIRESAFLGVPTVNIGRRQEGRVRGKNVVDVPHDHVSIERAVRDQVKHGPYPPDPIYGEGNAGKRIVEILKHFHFKIQKCITY